MRHATTGVKAIVVGIPDDDKCRNIHATDNPSTTWGLGQLQPAPGSPPAALADVAAAISARRGTWVRDVETGACGVIVDFSGGWRTILCDDGQELKRHARSFRVADGAPPAALVAKAEAWRKPSRSKPAKNKAPPTLRKRAAPADAESSEEEDDEESEESVPARPKRARAPRKSGDDVSFPVGSWVRDAKAMRGPGDNPIGGTGADGIVVQISGGWRTILCADGTTLKRHQPSLQPAPGSPPAALVAKAAKWQAPATPKPKPPPRAAAPPRAARRCSAASPAAPEDAPGRRLRPRGEMARRMAVAIIYSHPALVVRLAAWYSPPGR